MKESTRKKKEKIDRLLEQRVWAIWTYVRNHADNLDSERACNQIGQLVNEATAEVKAINEGLLKRNAELRERNKELRAILDSDPIEEDQWG